MKKINGTGVAMVTPFNKKGQLDKKALVKLTKHLIAGGIDFLVVMGTTAEAATLSQAEREKAIAIILKANAGRLPIVLGVGGNDTNATVEALKITDFTGIDAILSVTPYYNKPTQAGLLAHFGQVAKHSPVPIILYNVPGRTAVNMTAVTTLALAKKYKNIIAVKEASGNWEQIMQIIDKKPKGFKVFSGDDAIVMPLIAAGADGVISVTANAFPTRFSAMVNNAKAGKIKNARQLHYDILDFTERIFEEGNPAGIKLALSVLDICTPEVRLPLVKASKKLSKTITGLMLEL